MGFIKEFVDCLTKNSQIDSVNLRYWPFRGAFLNNVVNLWEIGVNFVYPTGVFGLVGETASKQGFKNEYSFEMARI